MKLLTKEIEDKFKKYPLGSQDGKLGESKVIAKFFNPYGAGTWLITEAVLEVPGTEYEDWMLFGFCHLGDNQMAEFGYVSLKELENTRIKVHIPLVMSSFEGEVERDKSYDNLDITLFEACKKEFGYIPKQFMN